MAERVGHILGIEIRISDALPPDAFAIGDGRGVTVFRHGRAWVVRLCPTPDARGRWTWVPLESPRPPEPK